MWQNCEFFKSKGFFCFHFLRFFLFPIKCTLKVLCKEKNIDLVTWSSSQSVNLSSLNPAGSSTSEFEIGHESQVKLFQQFLFKSSRYEADQLFTTGNSKQTDVQYNNKIVLMVKEIPNVFFRDGGRAQLAACLRQYTKYSRHPLVFVVTQTSYASAGDSCNPNRLFTSDLKRELGVLELSFNAIANTFLLKHLDRIVRSEGLTAVADRAFLDGLCQIANGDLRNAVNTLEVSCVGKASKPVSLKISQSQPAKK